MALSVPRAPLVASGDSILSKQAAGQARTARTLHLSGLGDIAWRIPYYFYNGARSFRNEDDLGLSFPPEGEFFSFYQHLDPEYLQGASYPESPFGEPEGINLGSLIGAYVGGSTGFASEEDRLNETFTLWQGLGPPATVTEVWELGKAQRGVIDPETGMQSVPALEAAQSANITTIGTSPLGKGWGGLFPTPIQLAADCGSIEETGEFIPSYAIKFTALNADVATPSTLGTVTTVDDRLVVTYAGSCPEWTEYTAVGHVFNIVRTGRAYYVFVNNGSGTTVEAFPTADWLEGPYTGNGELFRYDGGIISRALWNGANNFRGTEAQRTPDTFNIREIAFSFQEFTERQYLLAPNLGGYNGVDLEALYPTAKLSADSQIASGEFLKFGAQTFHEYRTGFTCAGFYAKAEHLAAPVTLNVMNGETIIGSLTLTPGEPAAMKILTAAVVPNPLKVKLSGKARFTEPGSITFEALELYEYLPDHFDAAFLLRMASTGGGFEGEGEPIDSNGLTEEAATDLFESYALNGCIINTVAAGVRSLTAAISENPGYDAFRRLSREMMRIVMPEQILSYEVTGGKSIVRFKRWARGASNIKADYFYAIAPSWKPVSKVIEGEVYVVRASAGGRIIYGGRSFTHNQRFTGQQGISELEEKDGATLHEYDGIKASARKNGWSNEWAMLPQWHRQHPSFTSLWYQDTYSRHFTFNNPAHFMALSGGFPTTLHAMVTQLHTFTDYDFINPEAPTAFNYFGGANSSASENFCRAHQIYPEPYQVESCIVEFADDTENDVIKMTFTGRFRSHPDAPSTVDADYNSWSAGELSDLEAEDYRTDDNGIRQFIALEYRGVQSYYKEGDNAANSTINAAPDNPFSGCIPHLLFSRIPSMPYADGNDLINTTDTRVTVDNFMRLEAWIKIACEGFINGLSTQSILCELEAGSPYDYLFEDLTYDANGKRHIGDLPTGHGPMANTTINASLFNEFSNCLNLLNRVAVHGLMDLEVKIDTYLTEQPVEAGWSNGFTDNCLNAGGPAAWYEGGLPSPALDTTGTWAPSNGFTAEAFAAMETCVGGSWGVGVTASRASVRFVQSSSFTYAVSPTLQDLITAATFEVYGSMFHSQTHVQKTDVLAADADGCVSSGAVFLDGVGGGWHFEEIEVSSPNVCMAISAAAQTKPKLPGSALSICSQDDSGSVQTLASFARDYNLFSAYYENSDNAKAAILVIPFYDAEEAS